MNSTPAQIVSRLKSEGFIKHPQVFSFALGLKKNTTEFKPGGYNLSKNLNVWQIIAKLTQLSPDFIWLTIPEGLRKEQIGEVFAAKLNWSPTDLVEWNEKYTRLKFDYLEGVYFPDTYLVSASETPSAVAERLITHFNEVFSPYMTQFAQKDILWTTGLKIASLIERETADKNDMPLISGIIWNRLLSDTKLDIDATLQYAKGKVGDKWWSQVTAADKKIDSPYNTYLYKGLPPTPICNPGLNAIEAALNPAETDCIFYLHDKNGTMHCSKTYREHLENIDLFLRT